MMLIGIVVKQSNTAAAYLEVVQSCTRASRISCNCVCAVCAGRKELGMMDPRKKRLPADVLRTLEMLYSRTAYPSNEMIKCDDSVCQQ